MSKKAFKFSYKKMSNKAVDSRINERSGTYDKYIKPQFSEFKLKEGTNKIRIIPCPATLEKFEDYGLTIFVHYGIGADNNQYLSLKEHLKKPDPVAEERDRLSREGNEDGAKKLRPGKRVLFWVIDRKDEDKGPQVFSAPLGLHQDILKVSKDEGGGLLHHYDPEDGYDVVITRTGTGKENTEYTPTIARKSTPLSDDEDKMTEWLQFVTENSLEDALQFYDYDHIEAVFAGGKTAKKKKGKDEDDDEEEETPKTRKDSKKRVDMSDDEDDDEDEAPAKGKSKKPADDDEDEDEDEDEAPAKGKGKSKSKADDDDEDDDDEDEKPKGKSKSKAKDDDEDDEDEDEDEAPKSKSKSKSKSKGKAKDDDDDEDEDEDEAPAKGKGKSKSKADDDDDEDEEEDDEEDEKPKGKAKSKGKSRREPVDDDDEDEDDDD